MIWEGKEAMVRKAVRVALGQRAEKAVIWVAMVWRTRTAATEWKVGRVVMGWMAARVGIERSLMRGMADGVEREERERSGRNDEAGVERGARVASQLLRPLLRAWVWTWLW